MHSSAVFGPPGYIHKPLKKRRKKGYPKAPFTKLVQKVRKRRKKRFGEISLQKRIKKRFLSEGRKKGESFFEGRCGSTDIANGEVK